MFCDKQLNQIRRSLSILQTPDSVITLEELTVGLDDIPPTLKKDVIEFLNDWFRNHILIEDMKLKPYLENLND